MHVHCFNAWNCPSGLNKVNYRSREACGVLHYTLTGIYLIKSSSDSRNGAKTEERKMKDKLSSVLPHALTNSMSEWQDTVSALTHFHLVTFDPLTTPTLQAAGQCQNPHFSCLSEGTFPWTVTDSCRKLIGWVKEKTNAQYLIHSSMTCKHMERNVDTDKKT